MAQVIQVEAARIPDRDRLLGLLLEHGFDASAEDEVGIVVHAGGRGHSADEVFGEVEDTVLAIGSVFVPMKHDDVIYLRPPIG
jgi:hypothetical protein